MTTETQTNPTARHTCAGCDQPIKAKDIGGVARGRTREQPEVWFHNDPQCILDASEYASILQVQDMKKISKELKHGKAGIIEALSKPPSGNVGSFEF